MGGVRFALALSAMLALAAPALSAPATQPATQPAPDTRDIPPLIFFLATGDPDACGPGCTDWIGAYGQFDAGAPARLRALLGKLGKRKLPIFFFSPGGSVPAAMEIGRIMRMQKLRAGVGRTIPLGCEPELVRDKACDGIMRGGQELVSELRPARASCNSACVYALFGATEREVAPGAALGVHSISIRRTLVRQDREGRILATSSTRITGNTPGIREAHERVARYAAQMGISRDVVEIAAAVPFEKVRFLSREEIARFGIDTRALVESRWTREEDKSGRAALVKHIVSAAGAPARYRESVMRLSCLPSRQVFVQLIREQPPAGEVALNVETGGAEIARRPFGKPLALDSGRETEVRYALAPPAYFETAAKAGRIELVETVEGGTAQRTALSTAGLAGLRATLGEGCQ
jgi:hypothetical protein